MVKDGEISAKQASFIEYYADTASETYNNAMQSAIKAGYALTSANQACRRLVGNVRIKTAIDAYRAKIKEKTVATRLIRQNFWSDMMQDKDSSPQDRLRASELLGRSEADFTDNIANTVEDQTQTLTKHQQVEALRAQIKLLDDSESAGTAIAV